MEVQFPDSRTEKLFNSEQSLRKRFGLQIAECIQKRLVQLEAAACLEDLRYAPGKWHELTGDRKGQIACTLTKNWRLVARPPDPPPTKADGGLNWAAVTVVLVLEAVDYH